MIIKFVADKRVQYKLSEEETRAINETLLQLKVKRLLRVVRSLAAC